MKKKTKKTAKIKHSGRNLRASAQKQAVTLCAPLRSARNGTGPAARFAEIHGLGDGRGAVAPFAPLSRPRVKGAAPGGAQANPGAPGPLAAKTAAAKNASVT